MCVKEDVAKPNLDSSSRWTKIDIGPKNVWNANTPCVWIVTRNTKVATWPNEGFKRMLQGGPLTTNGDVRLVSSRNENENDLGRLLSTFFCDLIWFVEHYYLHSCGFLISEVSTVLYSGRCFFTPNSEDQADARGNTTLRRIRRKQNNPKFMHDGPMLVNGTKMILNMLQVDLS